MICDAQSVKNTDTAGCKGYDAGKKVSGIKRHIVVDTQGWPHAVAVTPAEVTDRFRVASISKVVTAAVVLQLVEAGELELDEPVLDALLAGGWLAEDALVVWERSKRDPAVRWPGGYEVVFERTYGETAVEMARRVDTVAP